MLGFLRFSTVIIALRLTTVFYNNGGECGRRTVFDTKGVARTFHSKSEEADNMQITINQVEDEDACSEYNRNSCGCALNNCDVIVSEGRCATHKKDCGIKSLGPEECRRKNGFYSVGGRICEHWKEEGKCDRDTTSKSNFGVNLNGLEYTDMNQVHYMAYNIATQIEANDRILYRNAGKFGTSICKEAGRGDMVSVTSRRRDLSFDDMKSLLWSYAEGSRIHKSTTEYNPCLNFTINFKDDGIFELNVKTGEMEYPPSRVRLFDIKFSGITVFPKVDLIRLAGSTCVIVDLFINFVVGGGQTEIILAGFSPIPLGRGGSALLQFCDAECGAQRLQPDTWEDNFIAMTAAVTKFKE